MLPTSRIMIKKFQDALDMVGIPSTIRHTMGDDIDAACGQLAGKVEDRSRRNSRSADAVRATGTATGSADNSAGVELHL